MCRAGKGLPMGVNYLEMLKFGLKFMAGEDGSTLASSVEKVAGNVEHIARLVKETAREARVELIPKAKMVYDRLKSEGKIE